MYKIESPNASSNCCRALKGIHSICIDGLEVASFPLIKGSLHWLFNFHYPVPEFEVATHLLSI